MSSLNPEELDTLKRFENWLKKLFNTEGFLHVRPSPLTVVTHRDLHGNLTINRGEFILKVSQMGDHKVYSTTSIKGSEKIISVGNNLTQVLIKTLSYCIDQHFIANHQP